MYYTTNINDRAVAYFYSAKYRNLWAIQAAPEVRKEKAKRMHGNKRKSKRAFCVNILHGILALFLRV